MKKVWRFVLCWLGGCLIMSLVAGLIWIEVLGSDNAKGVVALLVISMALAAGIYHTIWGDK